MVANAPHPFQIIGTMMEILKFALLPTRIVFTISNMCTMDLWNNKQLLYRGFESNLKFSFQFLEYVCSMYFYPFDVHRNKFLFMNFVHFVARWKWQCFRQEQQQNTLILIRFMVLNYKKCYILLKWFSFEGRCLFLTVPFVLFSVAVCSVNICYHSKKWSK